MKFKLSTPKQITKILVFTLAFSLSLWNCQKDDETNQVLSNNEFGFDIDYQNVDIRNLTSNSKEAAKVFNSLKSLNRSSNSSNKSKTETNTYEVDSSNVAILKVEDSYTSYTFPVVSETNNNLLENIIVSVYIDGSTDVHMAE